MFELTTRIAGKSNTCVFNLPMVHLFFYVAMEVVVVFIFFLGEALTCLTNQPLMHDSL